MDAIAYLDSLGIELIEASQLAIGRLAIIGEFALAGERGVLVRPKRGDVSVRYLILLAAEGYKFVIVDSGGYPAFYALEGESMAPIRALPVEKPEHFPSPEVINAWTQLIQAAASRGEQAQLGVAQLVECLDDDESFGSALSRSSNRAPVARIDPSSAVNEEPLWTAAALLAGYRMTPKSAVELVRLVGALSSLLQHRGELSGLTEALTSLVATRHLGPRRLVVSGGIGAELSAVFGEKGTVVLPIDLRFLGPVLERVLSNAELVFTDFLLSFTDYGYEGVVVVPPLGQMVSGVNLAKFELSRRGGKPLMQVPAEILFVEHALAATSNGGLLVAVLTEGMLSSAGHAGFREWLLDRSQLLAVISLPVGSCFRGTGVKCSVVLLKKTAPPLDYSILMIDIEANGFAGDVVAAKTTLDEFLDQGVLSCV